MIYRERVLPTCENAIVNNNKLWFTEMSCNELFYYDLLTEKTFSVCKFSSEIENGKRLFGAIIQYQMYLYLFPFSATKIYKVDVRDSKVMSINIRQPDRNKFPDYLDYAKGMSAHLYQNCIYMMPTSYPAIVEVNCETDEVTYYDGWITDAEKTFGKIGNVYFRKTMLKGENIYAPLCNANGVLVFNVLSKQYSILTIGSMACRFSAICYDGRDYWLASRTRGPVVRWNEESGEWKEFEWICDEEESKWGMADVICFDGKVLFFSMLGTVVRRVAPDGNSIVNYDFYENDEISKASLFKDNNKLYVCSAASGYIYIMTQGCASIERKPIYFPLEKEKYYKKYCTVAYRVFAGEKELENIHFKEEYEGELKDYFSYIINVNKKDKDIIQESIGNKILSQIKL